MTTPHPAPDVPEPTIDPAVARAELRLAKLASLSDKALAMARAVKEDGAKESGDTFAKLSRAVRLTIALEAKLEEGPRARAASKDAGVKGPITDPGDDPADFYAPLKTGKKARVRALVRDVIERETPDPEEADTLGDALDERLLCDRAYKDIETLPLRDIVEHLCADLELKPKWYRWIEEKEGWKPNPPFYRPLCSEFRTPSRRPIFNDLPEDEPDPLE